MDLEPKKNAQPKVGKADLMKMAQQLMSLCEGMDDDAVGEKAGHESADTQASPGASVAAYPENAPDKSGRKALYAAQLAKSVK